MDCRNSNVSLYSRESYFRINGVTSRSLPQFPTFSNQIPGMHLNSYSYQGVSASIFSAPNVYPISQQRVLSSFIRESCNVCPQNELLNHEIDLIRRDLTRQYHEHIGQQDIAFRQRLNELYRDASSLQDQLLQPESRKRPGQILQPNSSKKLKLDSSRSTDSGLPERPGWCSLCEVDCKTEVVLKDHILGKKHQLMLNKLKEGLGDGSGGDSTKQNPQSKQQHQQMDIIDNLKENENQVKEGVIPSKKHKRSSNRNRLTVECKICDKVFLSQAVFESHIAGKKHAKQLKKNENS